MGGECLTDCPLRLSHAHALFALLDLHVHTCVFGPTPHEPEPGIMAVNRFKSCYQTSLDPHNCAVCESDKNSFHEKKCRVLPRS